MLLVLLLATAGLLLAPQAAASGALQGLRACAARVIPALLPFFVVSRMLTALPLPTPGRRADRLFRALFGVRAACLPALLTGLLGRRDGAVPRRCTFKGRSRARPLLLQ